MAIMMFEAQTFFLDKGEKEEVKDDNGQDNGRVYI